MNGEMSITARLATSLRPLMSFAWRMVVTLTVCRIIFVAWQWQSIVEADMLGNAFLQGLRFDLVLLGLMLAVPVLCFPILASNRYLVPAWRTLLKVCLPLALLLIVFMECSTPSFVDQFDSRPNILLLEYLNHPKEVGATLWAAYKLPITFALVTVSLITWLNARQLGRLVVPIRPTGVLPALIVAPLLLALCVGLIRSTLDHRPASPSTLSNNDTPAPSAPLAARVVPRVALWTINREVSTTIRLAP